MTENHDSANTEKSSAVSPDEFAVALFDVLGFESLLRRNGLAEVQAKYMTLINYVRQQTGGLDVVALPDGSVAVGWLMIGNAYFSDSLLFWTRYSKVALPDFTRGMAEAVCHGLENGLALRGAIAVGQAVLDSGNGVYLGEPLVEIARTEREQRWIGLSFGPSFGRPGYADGFYLNTVLPFKSHYKDPENDYATGMTVDWPRRWRESRSTNLTDAIRALDVDSAYAAYYENTIRFAEFSEQTHDWFRRQQHLDYG